MLFGKIVVLINFVEKGVNICNIMRGKMRRKSERKSCDASSSIPLRRTSRRSKKSPMSKIIEPIKFETTNIVPESNELNIIKDSQILLDREAEASSSNSIIVVETNIEPQKNSELVELITSEFKSPPKDGYDNVIGQVLQNRDVDNCLLVFDESSNSKNFCSEVDNVNTLNKECKQNVFSKTEIDPTNAIKTAATIMDNLKDDASEIHNVKLCSDLVLKNNKTKSINSENSNVHLKVGSIKKRKWLSKNFRELKAQIMSISTDSLKNLIPDVHPVPLSDIKLESSSEVEEICYEKIKESNFLLTDHISKPDQEISFIDESPIGLNNKKQLQTDIKESKIEAHLPLSPPTNEPSTVLFITNLVRPFTILQLKGLLARTGKIMPGGFWIDRIKSKCYVRYEKEDEAIETRHALHGVRWPASNPKCLSVDFGDLVSLEKAVSSSCHEIPKFGQDINSENRIIGTGWDRELDDDKVQISKPVREWDVGKKEDFGKETDKCKDRERTRGFDRDKDWEGRIRRRSLDKAKYCSLSPDSKKSKKKENDPPLRLLDDLFRKTTVTPCIYWLPLTPEQIADKEAFRIKRITEHQARLKQRELEREKIMVREKERAKEKDRQKVREKDKEKERRRERSAERRKSRSRDKRRY